MDGPGFRPIGGGSTASMRPLCAVTRCCSLVIAPGQRNVVQETALACQTRTRSRRFPLRHRHGRGFFTVAPQTWSSTSKRSAGLLERDSAAADSVWARSRCARGRQRRRGPVCYSPTAFGRSFARLIIAPSFACAYYQGPHKQPR